MYLYIIIGLLIVFVVFTLNKQQSKEHLENCYLNVNNTTKNGNKTFFTNNMLDVHFNKNESIEKLKLNNIETKKTLEKYKKNVYDSNNEYTKLNMEYNQFNTNMDSEFNKLNVSLENKINEAKTLKQTATDKFNKIDNKMISVVGNPESSLDTKLKPFVDSSIKTNLDQLRDQSLNNINTDTAFNNRMTQVTGDINNWQVIPGYGCPMRVDPSSGEIQCLSYDGTNCELNFVQQNGSDLTKINNDKVKPVTCSNDGYTNSSNWCKGVYDYFAKNFTNQLDWANCPVGWTSTDSTGMVCKAPDNYDNSGGCSPFTFHGYTNENKQSWSAGCKARWPFKVNILSSVNKLGQISNTIDQNIVNKLGKIIPRTELDTVNAYNNGVYVQAYKLGLNNTRGDKLKDGIITTNINFNWGVGLIFGIRENDSQTNTNTLYLETTGFIKTPANATSIKFKLTSDDGSRLILSDNTEISAMKIVIDMWQSQSLNSKESSPITIKGNQYLPFQIQFFESYGSASLKLEWSVNGGSFIIIPRESFYVNKEICNYQFNFKFVNEIDTKAQSIIPKIVPLIPLFDSASSSATTNEGQYTISVFRASCYPCYNITTSNYVNGGGYGSMFDNKDTTGVDMEAYSNYGGNYGFPYRIVVQMPVTKKFKGKLTMTLVSPWCGCLPNSMALLTMFQDASFFSGPILNQPEDISGYALTKISLGQVGNGNNGPTNHSWDLDLTQPFNSFIFEIYGSWGSACRSGSNSVWITSINFLTEDAPQAVGVPVIPIPIQILKTKNWLSFTTAKLLYSARVNGWSASTFHSLCNNKGPTITIVNTYDGRFIGAYNPNSWGGNTGWVNTKLAFTFDSNEKYTSEYGTWGYGNYTVFDHETYLPTFGGGHDFYIYGGPTLQNCAYTFMNSNRKGPLGTDYSGCSPHKPPSNLEVYSVDSTEPIQLLKTKNWLSFTTAKLLYKASVNGWSAYNFHSLCDNKGATITIAYINDGRFIGAYNPNSWWGGNSSYETSKSAFLFDSNDKYPATYGYWGDGVTAIYNSEAYLPTFGGGHDFYISPDTQNFYNQSYTFVNSNRQAPLGKGYTQYTNYTLSNLEVYQLN